MTPASEAVQSFVLRYFQLLGARIEETEPGLFRIEVDRGLAAELERDTMPAWMWMSGPEPPAHVTYYFAFRPEIAERYPEAELVSAGSHRLQQVIESVRAIAKGTRAHLPLPWPVPEDPGGEGAIRYRPFYVFCLRLECLGVRPFSRLFCVAVDRVDLLPLRQLGELFPRLELSPGRPGESNRSTVPVEPARADLETAFGIAYRELLDVLETSDIGWVEETLASIDRERTRLEAYFADCEHDGLDVQEEREQRLSELEGMRPRVFVRLQGVCEAYLPVRYSEGSVQHLALSPVATHTPALMRRGLSLLSRP